MKSVMTDYANVRWQDVRQSVRTIRKTGPLSLPSWPGGHLALDVRELRTAARGQVGLYVDNGSDGVFANVRMLHGS